MALKQPETTETERPMSADDALQEAMWWAEGHKSHWNQINERMPGHTSAHIECVKADCAEAIKWTHIERMLRERENETRVEQAIDPVKLYGSQAGDS